MFVQDYCTEHHGYEDLTRLAQDGNELAVDTSSFKGAGVSELFLQEKTYEQVDSPIRELKEIVLGLDWEITDDYIERFLKTTKKLQRKWQDDKIVLTFLRLLQSLGQYIGAGKSRAHADAVNLLFSVYNALEKIVLSPGMDDSNKQKLLNEEMSKSQILNRIVARSYVAHLEKIIQKARREGTSAAPRAVLLPLKVLVLAFDGEKSGKIINKFRDEISFLQNKWQDDKNLLLHLKMLGAAGEYINREGMRSAPGAGKLFLATYSSLERIILTKELSGRNKKEITLSALRKFNQLKKRIARATVDLPDSAPLKIQQGAVVLPAAAGPDMRADPGPTPEAVGMPAAAAIGDRPAEEWTPQTLEAHLDHLFQEKYQEGISLPFFEGRKQRAEADVCADQPPASAELAQGPSPAQSAAGPMGTEVKAALPAAVTPQELAGVFRAVPASSREVEQLRSITAALSEKVELLLNQQMLLSVCTIFNLRDDITGTGKREFLTPLLADFRRLCNLQEKLIPDNSGHLRNVLEKLCQWAAATDGGVEAVESRSALCSSTAKGARQGAKGTS